MKMNGKGFVLIALIVLTLFLANSCSLDNPESSCFYSYTDINGNKGTLKYCYTTSGQMICSSGDFNYEIKVVEYYRFCNEEVSERK